MHILDARKQQITLRKMLPAEGEHILFLFLQRDPKFKVRPLLRQRRRTRRH